MRTNLSSKERLQQPLNQNLKKFVPPFLVGNLRKKSNINTIQQQETKKPKVTKTVNNKLEVSKKQSEPIIPKFEKSKSVAPQKSKKSRVSCPKEREPNKSPFHLYLGLLV